MLLTERIEIEGDVLMFAFEVAGRRIERMADVVRQGNELRLLGLHLQGEAKNQVGRPALRQVAYELGRYFGVSTLQIEGGRRTTGRYKGQIPTPLIISIPAL